MFTLDALPSDPVRGDLGGRGEGVVGVKSGGATIRIFPGALKALQEVYEGAHEPARLAVASSADTPFAASIAQAALDILEVLPGVGGCVIARRGRSIGRRAPRGHGSRFLDARSFR